MLRWVLEFAHDRHFPIWVSLNRGGGGGELLNPAISPLHRIGFLAVIRRAEEAVAEMHSTLAADDEYRTGGNGWGSGVGHAPIIHKAATLPSFIFIYCFNFY